MLRNKQFREYWDKYKNLISDIHVIKLIESETEIANIRSKIPAGKYAFLVGIPSINGGGSSIDSRIDGYASVLFILTPYNKSNDDENKLIEKLDGAQDILEIIIEGIAEDTETCHFLKDYEYSRSNIDPEINLFETCGYSMSLNFNL